MPDDKTIDFVVGFVAVGLLTLGLGSWLLGKIMSRFAPAVPANEQKQREHRSQAAEQRGNGAEQPAGTSFRSVIDYLERCDDDTLLNILANLSSADGDYRFAESRIAKFIPGRVEDRLAQVRAVRDIPPPAPLPRMLTVRDEKGERQIPIDA